MGLIIFTILTGVLMYFNIISVTAFLCIVGGLVVWFYTAPLLYFKFGFLKFFYHDFLHWHTPDHSPPPNVGRTVLATMLFASTVGKILCRIPKVTGFGKERL